MSVRKCFFKDDVKFVLLITSGEGGGGGRECICKHCKNFELFLN